MMLYLITTALCLPNLRRQWCCCIWFYGFHHVTSAVKISLCWWSSTNGTSWLLH